METESFNSNKFINKEPGDEDKYRYPGTPCPPKKDNIATAMVQTSETQFLKAERRLQSLNRGIRTDSNGMVGNAELRLEATFLIAMKIWVLRLTFIGYQDSLKPFISQKKKKHSQYFSDLADLY